MNRAPPSYEAFKTLASFSPDLGDFGIREANLKRLIGMECGIDVHGVGMGDFSILYLSLARKGFVTYEGVLQLQSILVKRAALLEKRILEEKAKDAVTTLRLQEIEKAFRPPIAATFSRMFARPSQFDKTLEIISEPSKSKAGVSTSFERLSGLLQAGRAHSGSYLTSTSAQAATGSFQAIYHQHEPLMLIREILVLPELSAPPHIKSKVEGLKQMREATPAFVISGGVVLECWKEWEQELGGSDIPLAGKIYFYLICGCCLVDIGDITTAKLVLASAQHQFDSKLLGIDHPLNNILFLTLGIAHYMAGEFEDALREFESALDLAELLSKQRTDASASMNAATARNNIGCCHMMMGQRSEAVSAFRQAVSSLKLTPSGFNNGASASALTNLNRAVKLSFAFPPTSSLSRPLTAPVSSPLRPTSSNEKLKAFLRSAVTLTQPSIVSTVPIWATRSDGEEAAKKAASKAKGGKDGKKDAKKDGKGSKSKKKGGSKIFSPSYPAIGYDMPSFGVANVILPKKPKAKKKKEDSK